MAEGERRYPASAAQRRLWFIAAMHPGSCVYNNAHVIRFRGALDTERLAQCLQHIARRHESLRTRFEAVETAGEEVEAIVAARLSVAVRMVDLCGTEPDVARESERTFIDSFARAPFDVAAGPLVRAALVRHSETHHVLAIVLHHIVSDRWSFGILLHELATLYGTAPEERSDVLAPLRFGYSDYAKSVDGDDDLTQSDLAYWRAALAGERVPLQLPLDRGRPPLPSYEGGVVAFSLEPDRTRSIVRAGAALRATPFMTFLAAFLTLLQRYTGQTDLLIGTPVAGRGRLEREAPIGLFVNTLPLRVRTATDATFSALLASVRAATLDLLTHQAVPFDRLVRETLVERDPSRNPFFDILFNFHNTPFAARWPRELMVETEDIDLGTSRLDLSLVVRPEADGRMTCRFEYSSALFDVATIEQMAAQYGVLLDAVALDPHAPLDRLPLSSANERETVLNVWSVADATPGFTPHAGHAGTIHSLVERAALRSPDAIALVEDGNEPCSYLELERRANRLANALRARGVARDVPVGLFLERSVSTVVAMLAVLKAGGAYMPIDPAYPAERIAFMLASAGARTIVARGESFDALAAYDVQLIDVDDSQGLSRYADTAPPNQVAPHDLAYVLYTSGSTGKPKAVAIEHRGVVALVTATPPLAFTPRDAYLMHAALTFDASTYLWAPLAYGARLAVMPPGPFSLAEFGAKLKAFDITVLEATPAFFHQLVEERLDDLRGLRRCLVGGDVLSPAISARFVEDVRGCRLFNGYGPTETTVIACSHEVRPHHAVRMSVPIGRPVAHMRAYILDRHREPVAAGVPGELYLGGDGLARGYLNDSALTAERFQPDPFVSEPAARMYRTGDRARWLPTGEIEFLGRVDGQIKVRGFRVEPAEIEFALLEHPAVRHAAVALRRNVAEEPYLVGYAEMRGTGETEATLREFLKTKLPAHAIPSRLVLLDELPKTNSGKLDRLRLPDPPERNQLPPDDGLARSPVERKLVAIVRELLGLERLGRNEDFFSLGAHSLLATRIIARIADAFDVDISLRSFFGAPTVAGIAHLVAAAPQRAQAEPDAALTARLATLSDAEIDALLAQTLRERTPSARFRCVLLGATTLVVRCAELLRERGHAVVAVIEPPLDALGALADVLRDGDIDYVFSVINLTYLDADILAQVRRGAINLHDAPLPRYAGRYATTWAIAAREREHGVTWHEMSGLIDAGRILKARSVPIENDTAFSLNIKCYEAAFAAFEELARELEDESTSPREQDLSQRTYFAASKRPSPACLIDWKRQAAELDAFVRALDFERTPNPIGRPTFFAGRDAYACRAIELLGERTALPPGTIVHGDAAGVVVAAGDELVRLRDVARLGCAHAAPREFAGSDMLRAANVLRSFSDLPLACIAALEASSIEHEAYWVSRLTVLQPLVLPEFAVAAHAGGNAAICVDTGGASGFASFAAFCMSLAEVSGRQAFDVSFGELQTPLRPIEANALFAAAVPLRITAERALALAEVVAELHERCAAALRHGTFAWDVFARYPQLRERHRHFADGTLPVAVVVAPAAHFDEAGSRAALTLVIERYGSRTKLVFRRSAASLRAAQHLANAMTAALRGAPGTRPEAAGTLAG